MKNTIIVVAGIFAVGLVAVGAYFFGQQSKTPQKTEDRQQIESSITPEPTSTETPTVVEKQTGTIEGSLSFPSEGIPDDLKVCAEDTSTKQTLCTSEHLAGSKYKYGKGYKLEVPVGSYYVYAQVPSWQSEYRAYYNEFVTCGLSVDCQSHELIEIKVEQSAAITGIDPEDWYNQ